MDNSEIKYCPRCGGKMIIAHFRNAVLGGLKVYIPVCCKCAKEVKT